MSSCQALFEGQAAMETEFKILLILLDEMVEFVVPFGVTIVAPRQRR